MQTRVHVTIGFAASVTVITMLASVAIVLTPFMWHTSSSRDVDDDNSTLRSYTHHGLFVACVDPYDETRSCKWSWDDTFETYSKFQQVCVTGAASIRQRSANAMSRI